MLRDTVAALVDKHAAPAAVRAAMESERGYDEALWQLLCEQVGAAALVIPEELGGAGGELADAAVVIEELGRALVPTPLLGTTLAELALLAAASPTPRRSAGSPRVPRSARWCSTRTTSSTATSPTSSSPPQDGQLSRWTTFTAEPVTTMDPTRRLARVEPQETVAVGTDPGLADTAAILLAAEQIGAAERCLELTVAYTKDRVQFGSPIGSFQALKHRMADLYVAVQRRAPWSTTPSTSRLADAAALARLAASEAFSAVAAEAIQLHGGIAITWEHDIQLYFKRAHGSAQLLGPPREHLRRLEVEVLSSAVNDRVALRAGIPPFYVMDVWLAAAERQRTHGDLVNLSAGQPSAGAPRRVRAAAAAAWQRQPLGYTVALGIPELRDAIAAYYAQPVRHRRRRRRRRRHHGIVGRLPAGVPGVFRRRRPGRHDQPRLPLLPQHPLGTRLRGGRGAVRARDPVPADRRDARRTRPPGPGRRRRQPGQPHRHGHPARGAGGDRLVVRRPPASS